jgi:hypothetical protein
MQVAVSQDVLYKMQGHVEAQAALPHAVDGCRHRLQPIPHVHPTLSRRCSVLRRIDSAGAEVSQNWRRHGPKRWSLCPGPGQAIRWKIPQVPQSRLTQVHRSASPTGIPPFAVGRAISVLVVVCVELLLVRRARFTSRPWLCKTQVVPSRANQSGTFRRPSTVDAPVSLATPASLRACYVSLVYLRGCKCLIKYPVFQVPPTPTTLAGPKAATAARFHFVVLPCTHTCRPRSLSESSSTAARSLW